MFATPAADPMLVHVLRFGGALREHEVPVSLSSMLDLCRCFGAIELGSQEDLRAAARAVLITRREHLPVFDRVFDLYWRGLLFAEPRDKGKGREDREDDSNSGQKADRPSGRRTEAGAEPREGENEVEAEPERSEYSQHEGLGERDLATLSDLELAQARRIVAALVRQLASRESRRLVAAAAGDRLDVVRTQRRSLPYGQLPFELYYRKHKDKKPSLVLLCDVSGSMERYSSLLVQFICGIRAELARVEIGLFATRLTMVSSILERGDVQRSVARLAKQVAGWGSGTDIGASLRQFNDGAASRGLRRRTTVVILSDGWDRGDAAVMSEQMQRLRRSVQRIVWLNPLLGRDRYEPVCQGIRAALPYLDHFLPAHSIRSLEEAYRVIRTTRR